jgi:hypothetical protein
MKLIKSLAATGVLALSASNALALPQFSKSAALNYGSALTLYPDHQDPNLFYFMPNSSRIGRDEKGVPTFSFTYFGLKDPAATEAGALMVYVGRLTSEPEQKKALEQFLATHPKAGIAVLPIKESMISLDTTDPSKQPLKLLFNEFNFAHKGGRAEDEIGINAVATKIGAKIFKASILGEAGAVMKYDMCYKVDGLGAGMDGKIHVKMNRVYDHFAAKASGGYLWWRASIATEIETLRKTGDVSWEINGGDAKDEDYLRETTAAIVARVFKPELSMSPTSSSTTWDNATPFTLNASYTHKEESNEENWTIVRRPGVTEEFCVPLTIKDIQDYKKQCVIDADAQN